MEAVGEWAQLGPEAVGEWAQRGPEAVGEWAQRGPEAVGKWAQRGLEAVSVGEVLGSWQCLHPAQIYGSGRGKVGPSTRPCGIGSSCIDTVGLKQTHGGGELKFGLVQYLIRSEASALVKHLLHIYSIEVSQYSVSFDHTPLILPNSIKYRPRTLSRSLYDLSFIPRIILVNLLWTVSKPIQILLQRLHFLNTTFKYISFDVEVLVLDWDGQECANMEQQKAIQLFELALPFNQFMADLIV
eukprot:g46026.t1